MTPSTRRGRRGAVLASLALGLAAASALWWDGSRSQPVVRTESFRGAWVRADDSPSPSAFFRFEFEVVAPAQRAWVKITAHESFNLYVNGDSLARQHLWRPSRPFQNGLSERGQKLYPAEPAIALNYPRAYQWDGHDNASFATLVDITPALRVGKNVLAVQAETRGTTAAVRLDGEVWLSSGEQLVLDTSTSWRAATVPPGVSQPSWTRHEYDASDWSPARETAGFPDRAWRLAAPSAFALPFATPWMELGGQLEVPVWMETEWDLPGVPEEAWLRLLVGSNYDLFVNGRRVQQSRDWLPALAAGEWILSTRIPRDVSRRPDRLEPHETRSPWLLDRTQSATAVRPEPPIQSPVSVSRPVELITRQLLRNAPEQGLAKTESSDPGTAAPRSPPLAPLRDLTTRAFDAHDLRGCLRRGRNTIAVRIAPPLPGSETSGLGRIAVDARAEFADGQSRDLRSSPAWRWRTASSEPRAVDVTSWDASRAILPPLRWRPATPIVGGFGHFLAVVLGAFTAWFALLVGTILRRIRGGPRPAGVLAGEVAAAALPAALVVFGLHALGIGFAELSEARWWRQGVISRVSLLAACLPGLYLALAPPPGQPRSSRRTAPSTIRWAAAGVVVLALFLRAWGMSSQPLDDDECASMQAILAIIETGLPHMGADGIYYTRSPLYHYGSAMFALLFGPSTWVLRLPSVLFGGATCGLLFWLGSSVLRRPGIGLAAAALFAIHPYAVFTGHVARFYQQQQFFALWTIGLLVLGFVRGESTRLRIATLVVFLAAVLSQEISALLGFVLLAAFLFFRQRRRLLDDWPCVVVGFWILGIIALDYLAFRILCQTRTEAASTSVEARVALNFLGPFNLASMFVGYARLHVVASLFVLPSLFDALARRSRSWCSLHFVMFGGILCTNILVTHVSIRYVYFLLPVWIILVCHGVAVTGRGLAHALVYTTPARHLARVASTAILAMLVVSSWAPWRIPNSYSSTLLPDSTGALRHIATHSRAEDLVIVTEPHSHLALLEVGRIDGYLSFPLLYDFQLEQDGRVVDRSAGAPVLSTLDDVMDLLERDKRLWFALSREKLRSRGRNLRWEYPGARMELFLRRNCELVFHGNLWSVFLWDPAAGRLRSFSRAGG